MQSKHIHGTLISLKNSIELIEFPFLFCGGNLLCSNVVNMWSVSPIHSIDTTRILHFYGEYFETEIINSLVEHSVERFWKEKKLHRNLDRKKCHNQWNNNNVLLSSKTCYNNRKYRFKQWNFCKDTFNRSIFQVIPRVIQQLER